MAADERSKALLGRQESIGGNRAEMIAAARKNHAHAGLPGQLDGFLQCRLADQWADTVVAVDLADSGGALFHFHLRRRPAAAQLPTSAIGLYPADAGAHGLARVREQG